MRRIVLKNFSLFSIVGQWVKEHWPAGKKFWHEYQSILRVQKNFLRNFFCRSGTLRRKIWPMTYFVRQKYQNLHSSIILKKCFFYENFLFHFRCLSKKLLAFCLKSSAMLSKLRSTCPKWYFVAKTFCHWKSIFLNTFWHWTKKIGHDGKTFLLMLSKLHSEFLWDTFEEKDLLWNFQFSMFIFSFSLIERKTYRTL